ncbi:MAG: Hint domain-containing protein [Bacteroidota bacterium]
MRRLLTLFLLSGFLLAACAPIIPGGSGVSTGVVVTAVAGTVVPVTLPPADYTPPPYPTPLPPTPIPPLPGGLSPTALKYRLLDQYPNFFFCDPDYYPVAHEDELSLALARFPQIQADSEEFQAILEHNGLTGLSTFTDDQKIRIYQDYKKLNALYFEVAGDRYRFQFRVSSDQQQGYLLKGTIDASGKIKVDSKEATFVTCPICLAVGTLIDTPRGPVAVQDLQPGDPVWTVNLRGERISAAVLQTGHIRVPASHRMADILLEDGRELLVSPGHPGIDGRALGELRAGDFLDGTRVRTSDLVPYAGGATYDLLPSGPTGFYWANGILIASTLKK